MTTDPFVHLPALRDRLTPAATSELRVTSDVLASWDQRARMMGRARDWRIPCTEREMTRRSVLRELISSSSELWVFAYGSLMWDPGIHFSEVRFADLDGYQRRFSYRIMVGRGSPECPALMLALEPSAGCCRGLAFRIAADAVDAETEILWRREMIRGGYLPRLLPVATPQGDITALAFVANAGHDEYAGELPPDVAAAMIASASGPLGSNRAYLEQLAGQLDALAIVDGYVDGLVRRVRALPAG